jgi:hypothetical protein
MMALTETFNHRVHTGITGKKAQGMAFVGRSLFHISQSTTRIWKSFLQRPCFGNVIRQRASAVATQLSWLIGG